MRKALIRWKVYFDRARMYISYAQTAVVCLTAIKVFGIKISVLSGLLWVVVILAGCLLVGWVDCKLGVFGAENKRISEQNPVLMQILHLSQEKDTKKDNK